MMRVIGVAAGPEPDGRTSMAVAAVLDGVRGATTGLLELSRTGLRYTTHEIADADAVVFGSPVYRATYSGLLKHLLEGIERGMKGESTAPLRGKTAAVVLTGAGPHHFLAVADLRNVLASFFAVQVLSPGLYLDDTGYADRTTLTEESRDLAALHGRALTDLAVAARASTALAALRPQVDRKSVV